MELFGYFAAILIGLSLGLIGGGGSILTVPVLVYLFGLHPALATSYSLFIVGTSSLVGAWRNYLKGCVNIKTALLFGLSSITTVFLLRRFVIPVIPKDIFRIGDFEVTQGMLTMVLFAVLMLLASTSMIRDKKQETLSDENRTGVSFIRLTLYGIGIGMVTGFLGAGGGFLLIPALVLLMGLPMKEAIGTSLLIIALNSLIGFTGDLGQVQLDWLFLLKITSISVAGIFVGGWIGTKISGAKLKKGFGWFVLIMGVYILIREIFISKPG